MANISRVQGFRPVKHKSGGAYTGQVNKYFISSGDGTATFVGDLVKLAGSSDTDGICPTVIQAAATNAILGVVVGFAFDPTNLNLSGQYRAASTDRYVYVCDDPGVILEGQTSNDATPVAAADVGLNVDFAVAAGSAVTGKSGATIDLGTKAATSNLPLKIWGLSPRIDNEIGGVNAKVLVTINLHQRATGGTDDGGVQDGVIGV